MDERGGIRSERALTSGRLPDEEAFLDLET